MTRNLHGPAFPAGAHDAPPGATPPAIAALLEPPHSVRQARTWGASVAMARDGEQPRPAWDG